MNLSPLGVFRWWVDVSGEALASGVYVQQIEAQRRVIDQASRELVAAGHIDAATVEAAGKFDTPAIEAWLAALPKLHNGHYANVLVTYAQAIEQALARARGDQARVLNPTPREDYDAIPQANAAGTIVTPPKRAPGLAVLLAAFALLGTVGYIATTGGRSS